MPNSKINQNPTYWNFDYEWHAYRQPNDKITMDILEKNQKENIVWRYVRGIEENMLCDDDGQLANF